MMNRNAEDLKQQSAQQQALTRTIAGVATGGASMGIPQGQPWSNGGKNAMTSREQTDFINDDSNWK